MARPDPRPEHITGPQPTQQQVVWFLAITFVVSAAAWGSLALRTSEQTGVGGGVELTWLLIGWLAPALAAVLVAQRYPDGVDTSTLLTRLGHLEVPVWLFAMAVGGPFALGLAGQLLSGDGVEVAVLDAFTGLLPAFAFGLVAGGLSEIGWRGILQPWLSQRYRVQIANLAITAVWALWQVPLFLVAGSVYDGGQILTFLVAALGYNAIMTALYHRAGAIGLAVVFHAMIHTATSLGVMIPVPEAATYPIQAAVVIVVGSTLLYGIERRDASGDRS